MRFIVCVILFVVTGCVSTGNKQIRNETSQSLQTKLQKGMPQSEVFTLFGNPNQSQGNSDGTESWTYQFTEGKAKLVNFIPYLNLIAGGSDNKTSSLTINFDAQKRVVDYVTNSSQTEVRSGVIN